MTLNTSYLLKLTMNPVSCMPEWYQEITKEIKTQPKKLSSEKKAIINYLKEQIRQLEDS